jgi:hypothetical protein
VRRLEGCLADLPDHFRLLLELRTGVDAPRALSPTAVAEYLDIRVGEISRLEKQALRRLRLTARAHTCGRTTATLFGLLVPTSFGPAVGSNGNAAGGVEAVRYAKSLSREHSDLSARQASPSGPSLLETSMPTVAGNTLLLVVMVLGGVLLIGLVFVDELGFWAHLRWRFRWKRRPPWT